MLNVDQFVADCRAALRQSTPELAVKELLERTVASPSQVEAALGTPREGKIGVLHHAPDLTILNVVWTPGMAVYPHDHRMWAVIGLYGGREDNTFYRRSPEGLQVAGGKQLEIERSRGHIALQVVFALAPFLLASVGALIAWRRQRLLVVTCLLALSLYPLFHLWSANFVSAQKHVVAGFLFAYLLPEWRWSGCGLRDPA